MPDGSFTHVRVETSVRKLLVFAGVSPQTRTLAVMRD